METWQKAESITGISDSSAPQNDSTSKPLGNYTLPELANLNIANLVISLNADSLCNAVFFALRQ